MISRRTFRIFIILAGLSFGGVILTQLIWMRNAYSEKKEEFNRQLTLALQEVVRDILQYNTTKTIPANPVTQLTENYYAVMVNDLIDPAVLDHFIQKEFLRFHIDEDYAYSIYDCSNRQLVYGGYYQHNLQVESKDTYKFPPVKADNYYFTMYFPNIKLGLFSDMGLWVYLSLLVFLLLSFFTYSFLVITKQKRLSEIQRDFINNMAHEIRTPLTTIGLSATGIDQSISPENSKVKIYTGIIKEESEKLKLQLEKILSLEEGVELKKEWLDPNELVKNCVDRFVLLRSVQTDQFSSNLCNENIELNLDPMHFSQICSNLLDNAIKYSLDKVKIEVISKVKDDFYLLSVSDKGQGISANYQKKIFDRFFRVPFGNNHQVKGFGIGLYYVKQMVKAHGGKVWVESKVGEGSTFFISLPIQ
ncbi:MAG: HAMP domain-containing histidine kinase [Bacteroidia bacterium]|nr:HAMP domain-containing histidine kinase [Bacteroidia bacterium]MCF8427001.1 HAMP domain-containing histidine kinase [Bacteroidia bacterium]MCF8445620.1 HAMP domain-containing histidine kinase [Bacteroidia bacterium]